MLAEGEEFEAVGAASRPPDQAWTLSREPRRSASPLSLLQLVHIADRLTDEQLSVIRYGPYSLKSSPILREPALRQFLVFLLENAGGAVALSTIADVLRWRFRLFELEDVVLDDFVEAREPEVSLQVEHAIAAESVLARMGSDRVAAIRAFEEAEGDFSAAGAALGGGRREGEKAVSEVLHLIAELATSTEDARATYEVLVEKLF